MKIFCYISLVLLFFSCGGKAEKTVSFDDLTSDSEKYGDDDTLSASAEKKPFISIQSVLYRKI